MSYVALSGGELASLRDRAERHKTTWYLTIIPQSTVATAQVNQVAFTRPLAELAVDNTSAGWGSVNKNMTVWLGTTAGANDVGIHRVRKTPAADTLYIQELSNGDFGLKPTGLLQSLGDNLHVTIINDYNLWSVFSRIVYLDGSGTFFKDYDIVYDDQNKDKPPPVLKIGQHIADFVDPDTGLLTVSKTATALPWLSETVSSYSWDIDDGSFTVGNAASQSWTATFPAGHRVISCTVTLSSGATITAQRHVYAHNKTTYAPIEIRDFSSDSRGRGGRRATVDLFDPLTSYDLPNNAMVILWSTPSWGGNDIASASKQFVGFAKTGSGGIAAIDRSIDITTSFEVASPLDILKDTVSYSQALVVVDEPTKWTEFVAGLSTVDFVVFYLLYWHSTLLNLFDFEPSGITHTAPAWKVSSNNFVDQLNEIVARISGEVTQESNGTLRIIRDPLRLNPTERDALIERMVLTSQDGKAADVPSFHLRPVVGRVRANGLVSGLTQSVVHSFSPGRVTGQATQEVSLLNLLPVDQDDLNRIAADELARRNNPYGRITFNCVGNYDVIEPAAGYWVNIDVDADESPTGEAIQRRCAVIEVSLTHDENGVDMTTFTLEGEASGVNAPGETIIYPRDNSAASYDFDGTFYFSYDSDLPWTWPTDWLEDIYQPQSEETEGSVIAYSNSALGLSYSRVDTAWHHLYTVADLLKDFILDPASPRLTIDPAGKLGGFVLDYDTVEEETVLKYCNDLLVASPVFEDKQTIDGVLNFFRPVRGSGGILAFGSQTGSPDYYIGAKCDTVSLTGDGVPFWVDDWGVVPVGGNDDKIHGLKFTVTLDGATVVVRNRSSLGSDNPTPDPVLWNVGPEGNLVDIYDADGFIFANNTVFAAVSMSETQVGDFVEWDTFLPATETKNAGFRRNKDTVGTTVIDLYPIYYGDPNAGGILVYTDDQGDTISTATFGDGTGVDVADCDDFAGGAVLAANGPDLEYATAYDGAFSTASGLDAGSSYFSCLRIPYRRFSDSSIFNNDGNALEFIACFHAADGGVTIQWGEIDLADGSVSNLTDITPVISSVTYAVMDGPNTLETFGGNPNIMRCLARDESDEEAPIKLLFRDETGAWMIVQEDVDLTFLHHTGLSSMWLTGQDGIFFSSDGGATLKNRAGDFTVAISDFPVNGMRLF